MTLQISADPVPLYLAEEGQVVRVEGTRVSLDTIVFAYKDGQTPEQIAEAYATVSVANVHAVIAYYLRHRTEVDAYIAERERVADELQRQIESDPEYQTRRRELLAWMKERDRGGS